MAGPVSPSLKPDHAGGVPDCPESGNPIAKRIRRDAAASSSLAHGPPTSPSLQMRARAWIRGNGAPHNKRAASAEESQPRQKKQKASTKESGMIKASFPRASRAARAKDPSDSALSAAHKIVADRLREIKELGHEKAPRDVQAFRSHKMNCGSGGKGPGVRTVAEEQTKMNHIVSLKAKNVDSNNTEPAFLLGGFTAPMLWDRLAENSLSSNAVNNSHYGALLLALQVMGRKKTQGSANQTTRINCKSIGQAAAAQVTSSALVMAEARRMLREAGAFVVNTLAVNSVNLCAIGLADTSEIDSETIFGVTSTVRLVYNSSPVKVTSSSLIGVAIDLARRELNDYEISNVMGTRSHMIIDICKSIVGEHNLDSVWCSWVLIVYLCSNPRGREILRRTSLTDIDVQAAIAFERYGSEEIRRRARQRRDGVDGAKKRNRTEDDVDDEGDSFSMLVASKQRKRSARGSIVSGSSDAHTLLCFWHQALQSEDVSVLHTLAAHNKRTARDAALCTLARQAGETTVADNQVLQNVSLSNAVKSAQALVSFVGRREDEIPNVVLLRARSGYDGAYRTAVGFQRIKNEGASTAIHACSFPPLHARPPSGYGIAIAWSFAAKKMIPRDEESAVLPGILERLQEIKMIETSSNVRRDSRGNVCGRAAMEVATLNGFVTAESEDAMPTHATGTTRSFISLVTYMATNATHQTAAEGLVRETQELHASKTARIPERERFPSITGQSKRSDLRSEAICTPASSLAVGICANEALRRWMAHKSRKNDPCIKHLGFSCNSELQKDVPGIMSTEPSPLLTITDFEIERLGAPRPLSGKVSSAKAAVALHVCGDGATRVPEMLAAMRSRMLPQNEVGYTLQARAALFVAASQASFVGSVGGALTAGYTNASVASSKKISVADINKLLLLSPMDCYVAGLNNIQRSFDTTFYSGTYGCRVDTGFTMPGLYAHNLRSDKRQHGNCCLSEEVADELAVEFAKAHWVVFDNEDDPSGESKYYSSAPTATRGIPHNFIPGVHSVLNSYCDFIETSREITERTNCDTVDSIHCLPFSAFTQALRPDVEPTADASLRTCFREELETGVASGRAFLVDSTPEEWAIVNGPLLRRPCQVSSGDCPFATAYDAADTFFNVCNTLALLASCACRATNPTASPTECVEHLHKIITELVFGCDYGSSSNDSSSMSWAADAVLLINVLYPSCLMVGEYALIPAFAKAVPFCQKLLCSGKPASCPMEHMQITRAELKEARAFWSAFRRSNLDRCAWTSGLAPFLVTILTHNGSHKNSTEVISVFKTQLDDTIRAVWLVWSPDGVERPPESNPASEAKSPAHINRHHIDPVFVGDEENDVMQRAALIGIKPHSYRQVLAEMLGAHIDGVECNVALNEGGMALRVSSDATILAEDGGERTSKSISPIQTEGDESAYGSRQDKISGAWMQKRAWDKNALLGKHLYTSIEPPRSAEIRSRGEFGFSHAFQEQANFLKEDNQLQPRSYANARALVFAAADPKVAKAVNSSLV